MFTCFLFGCLMREKSFIKRKSRTIHSYRYGTKFVIANFFLMRMYTVSFYTNLESAPSFVTRNFLTVIVLHLNFFSFESAAPCRIFWFHLHKFIPSIPHLLFTLKYHWTPRLPYFWSHIPRSVISTSKRS